MLQNTGGTTTDVGRQPLVDCNNDIIHKTPSCFRVLPHMPQPVLLPEM
jgi:hypothetical protein